MCKHICISLTTQKQTKLYLSDTAIFDFANKYRIHPAIILGRACFEMNYYGVKTNIDKKFY